MLEVEIFLYSSVIPPFKKQELVEIKKHIDTLKSKEDALEENIDEYLRKILSEQDVVQYFAHAQHMRHFFSRYIIHDNSPLEFSFSYKVLVSRIMKGLNAILKHLSTLHTNMRSIKRVAAASAFI